MTILLDQRADGSLALYIDGDLQFDSRDECIYHEALVLPALALAERRRPGPLRAFVCGGGDGLAARELLKSPRLARVDLVDYDPAVLAFARAELAELNRRSLEDLCTRVYVEDASGFVERAEREGRRYDLVISDLTVPQDSDGARLHSVEWYGALRQLLGEDGVLAANAASPSGAPDAYWSIYNSMRAAGLFPRPYRVALPSFAAAGYGDDWGLVLASPRPISPAELGDDLALASPRSALRAPAQLRRMFVFPAEVAARRASARPTRAASDRLLHYFYNGVALDTGAETWDGLSFERDPAALPKPDDGRGMLPPELSAALSVPIGERSDEEALLRRVLDLMPALRRFQTREMIATFLSEPARFLAALDLPGLVERLLRRAAELPRRLVAELRLLRAKLRDLAGDHAALLHLGMRIVTIVTIVVVVANLLYPDAVYGKGGDAGGAYTGGTTSLSQPSHGVYDPSAPPDMATNGGFRDPGLGSGVSVDEVGTSYPTRRYRYYPRYYGHGGYGAYRSGARPSEPPTESAGLYRLTPETDILPDGKVAIQLSEQAYLLLGGEFSSVIDQKTGEPLLFLDREPTQSWRAAREIERQRLGLQQSVGAKQNWIAWMSWLEFAPWRGDDQRELANLQAMEARLGQARELLGPVPDQAPPLPQPPVPGAIELFSGVWLLPDGSALALRLPEGLAFMDGKGWYHDQSRAQPLEDPYPADFKTMMVSYLGQRIREHDAIRARLASDLGLGQADLAQLQQDKSEYDAIARNEPPSSSVDYGTSQIPLGEAQRRTNDDIARTQQRIGLIQNQINTLPGELTAAQQLIANFSR